MLKYQILSKSVHREPSCYTRTVGHTYMTRIIVAFRYFANAPTNKNYRKTTGASDNSRSPDRDQYHIFFNIANHKPQSSLNLEMS